MLIRVQKVTSNDQLTEWKSDFLWKSYQERSEDTLKRSIKCLNLMNIHEVDNLFSEGHSSTDAPNL